MKKFFFFACLLMAGFATAQTQEVRIKQYNLPSSHLGIQGYDPFAYFHDGKALKGQNAVTYTYQGVTYHFVSEWHRSQFMANPAQYEPQYGGWCAYAMGATGEKVEIDPATFKILNGKLYLFYHSYLNNTLNTWNKDEANLHTKADANWRKFIGA